MAPLPPQISRYKIESLIGRGGMGDLYLAHDPNTNRLVAIKLLNATLDSTELRERFAREARALAALNHPNIVNIYDTGEFDDSPFIVMEYVRGETLAEMIKRRAVLSVSQKLKLMAELCAGLAQAHEAGIIHRDIKPANLMVDQQGRLKILDFGIARVAEDNRTRVGLPLTQVNMMIGTPGYMSPEQIEGGAVDHRSDIFAVGAVCYALFSYGEAFAGMNTRQIESRVLQAQPAPLASIVPGLDPEIDAIVFRALKRDPNKRYQDAATFEKALERLRARLGSDGGQTVVARPTPVSPQSAGGKVREVRADAAYQRALAAYQTKASEAARRFAVEALAEDPSHAGARALLARLENRAPLGATQAAAPSPGASSTVVGTSVSDRAGGTLASRTVAGTSAGKPASTFASAPTVILPPTAARKAAVQKRSPRVWGKDQPLRKAYEQLWRRSSPSGRQEPVWRRYRWVILGVFLLLIVAGVVTAAIRSGLGFSTPGQVLTITRPTGGTISAAGITCGTRGTDCSASRPTGDGIELTTQADAGFTFVGYTGDCAPAGRTMMTGARTCGATFTKTEASAGASGATQALTIAPVPTGGTLEGLDIICGSKGSVCSVNYPDGVPAELHPTADPGYTFMGFTGDCVPLGHTQMTSPRTCGATFSPTDQVSAQPPIKSPPPGGRLARNGGGGTPQLPTSPSAPTSATAPAPALGTGPPSSQTQTQTPPARRGVPAPTVDQPPAGPVALPKTAEEFAKDKIQEALKEYCDAQEALDPAAVQHVYPRVNMDALKLQLNKSKYRSMKCKFGDVVFVSLDPDGGKASIKAPVKHIFEHTILTEKPDIAELNATITLIRQGPRAPWQIESAAYTAKKAE
jgi:hypothetical protein